MKAHTAWSPWVILRWVRISTYLGFWAEPIISHQFYIVPFDYSCFFTCGESFLRALLFGVLKGSQEEFEAQHGGFSPHFFDDSEVISLVCVSNMARVSALLASVLVFNPGPWEASHDSPDLQGTLGGSRPLLGFHEVSLLIGTVIQLRWSLPGKRDMPFLGIWYEHQQAQGVKPAKFVGFGSVFGVLSDGPRDPWSETLSGGELLGPR